MKRKLFFAAMLLGMGSMSFAQTTPMTNKNGLTITPEAGDWVLGMNAAPFLNYIGNMFNGTLNNSVGVSFVNNNAIYGKYFINPDMAYRGSFRITTFSNSSRTLIDTNTTTVTPSYIEDKSTSSGFAFYLSGGFEKRRGHNRLQGYYGADLTLTFGAAAPNMKNEYGLELDSANIADGYVTNGRMLSSKSGATFGVGVRPFVGVEYFVLPKLSIGGEFGWGLTFASTAGGQTVNQFYGPNPPSGTANSVYEVTTETGKSSSFIWNTDNLGGAIRILYHF
ncbi:MAG: hypothetical protein N4A41_04335 [Crocinitomicaceae bacterium]|jgi:hypothetical protein|nr:hypothetical protein [Crocinitomicaceae bacterium]